MSDLDILRSFAESRSADSELIRDGITYGTVRGLLADMAELEAEVKRLRKALNYATNDLDPEDVALVRQIVEGLWEPLLWEPSGHDVCEEKDATIKRLRDRLEQIADGYDGTGARIQGTGYPAYVQSFARKALEDTP